MSLQDAPTGAENGFARRSPLARTAGATVIPSAPSTAQPHQRHNTISGPPHMAPAADSSSPQPQIQLDWDETVPQQMLTRGTVVTLNVGPVGLAESFASLGPILAMRPVAVLLQEAHVPWSQMQTIREWISTSLCTAQLRRVCGEEVACKRQD